MKTKSISVLYYNYSDLIHYAVTTFHILLEFIAIIISQLL